MNDRQKINALSLVSQCHGGKIQSTYYESLNYYNNGLDASAYNYLLKIGKDMKYTLPAKPRNIDRLSPRLRYLKSRENTRKIPLIVRLIDSESIKEKNGRLHVVSYQRFLSEMENIMKQNIVEIEELESMIFDIDKYIQELMQSYISQQNENGEQPDEQEAYMMAQQEYYSRLDRLKAVINYKTQYLVKKNKGYKDVLEKVKAQVSMEYSDEVEANVDMLLRSLINEYHIDSEKSIAFDYSLKTALGAEYYYVDINANNQYPTFEALSPLDVFYPHTSNIWVQDGEWVVIRRKYTPLQILNSYKLTDEIKEYLHNRNRFFSLSGEIDTYSDSSSEEVYNNVYHIFWKDTKMVRFGIAENRYNKDAPHIHILEDGKNPRNMKVEKRPYVEIWEAVIVDGKFIVEPRVVPDVVRYENDYNNPKLPVIGLVFDNGLRKPYSLVLQTKDANELSKVINIKMEMLIALAGVKGFIMDYSQKPSNMSKDEWTYLKKMGTAWIESTKNGRPANFNQFQSYDDGLSPSIITLLNIDESLDKHFELVTGVTRQSLAQMEQYELKGTVTQAINQTLAIVESLYQTHEQIYIKAIEQYANLIGKYTNVSKIEMDAEDVNAGFTRIEIPPNTLTERDIRVMVDKDYTDQNILETYKQIALQAAVQKVIPINALSTILTSTTFRKMDKKLAELMNTFQTTMQQMEIETNEQKERSKYNYAAELEKLKGQIEATLKEYDMAIESQKLELLNKQISNQLNIANSRNAIDSRKAEMDYSIKEEGNEIKRVSVEKDTAVEMAYLQEQQRQAVIMEKLKALELKMNAIIGSEKNNIANKKITKSKEKIKD